MNSNEIHSNMTNGTRFEQVKNDLLGGLTAAVVALPLALAFGVQSGMGAIAGLYGAMMCGIFAALFGGTNTQVSGPTGPMTVVSTSVIGTAITLTGSLHDAMGIIIATFLLAGAFQILFGVLKIGKYIKYIPYPVLSGFMTGIGLIIILYQLYPFLGSTSEKSTLDILSHIDVPIESANWGAIFLGALTVAIIYLFPKLTKAIPSALIALLTGTLIAYYAHLNVPIIGDIPSDLPSIKLNTLTNIDWIYTWTIIEFAVTLAALGAIDSLLTSVIADNITKTKHNSNRELIGQGIGNLASALVGGLPGAGATMRTVVNINAGGRTKLSGFIHGVVLLAILIELGRYASYIPLSVLAGILITVGIGIIDYKGIRHLVHVPRTDACILVIVLFLTVFGNLLHAVGVGVVLACVLFMKQVSDFSEGGTTVQALNNFDPEARWEDEMNLPTHYKSKIYIKHLYGPLFFGFTSRFQELIKSLDKDIKILIIRLDKVPYIDQSGIYAMEESVMSLQKKDVIVLLTGVQSQPLDMLKKIDIIPALIPSLHVFDDFHQCQDWLSETLKDGEDGLSNILKELREIKKENPFYRR